MQASVVVVTLLLGSAAACFITNCPPGGKRSGGPTSQVGRSHTCASCGPGREGRCLGPEICCIPSVGCFMGTKGARLCRKENLVLRTCSNSDLKPCGSLQEGRCSASGLCCTEEKCEFDSRCVMEDPEEGVERMDRRRLAFLEAIPVDQWGL